MNNINYSQDTYSTEMKRKENKNKNILVKKYIKNRRPKRTGRIVYQNKLTKEAIDKHCYTSLEIKSIYPNKDIEMEIWIRGEKEENAQYISNKKTKNSVYLIKLECNNNYTNCIFTFLDKHTGSVLQLDYINYGKFWWLFK